VLLLLLLLAAMFVYSSRGKWVFPPLLWSFPSSTTLTSFPTPACRACAPPLLPPEALRPGWLVYLQSREGFPSPSLRRSVSPHPLSCVSLLFLLLITQFLFFPPGGGQSVHGSMLLWLRLVCGSTAGTVKFTWSTSSQAVWARLTGGPGALLVSPFNVKWRFSAGWRCGGVKVMPLLSDYACKVCLRCLSKISL
jgi:hypothetical protein